MIVQPESTSSAGTEKQTNVGMLRAAALHRSGEALLDLSRSRRRHYSLPSNMIHVIGAELSLSQAFSNTYSILPEDISHLVVRRLRAETMHSAINKTRDLSDKVDENVITS